MDQWNYRIIIIIIILHNINYIYFNHSEYCAITAGVYLFCIRVIYSRIILYRPILFIYIRHTIIDLIMWLLTLIVL